MRNTRPIYKERMRVTFVRADEEFIYVRPTERKSTRGRLLRVRCGVRDVNEDFTPGLCMLWKDATLNLLDVHRDEDGVLTPELIVIEPDYLVDVSTLAACFREYGHHPANYAYARLMPSPRGLPLVLGNIVNLFLDEWLHTEGEPRYADSMRKAFRQYALELSTNPELMDREREMRFFADCATHFDNLRITVKEKFAEPQVALDPTDALIEPTFVCDALGLQGRLDYMQRDGSAFIEMKSGRGDEYSRRGYVVPREDNRVQMLLYMAMLQYTLGVDHRRVRGYLLYTRYPLLMLHVSDWGLVKRAIDLRNRIVAVEHDIVSHDDPAYTADRLADISPETLNERHIGGRLWYEYQAPAIDEVRCRLQSLSPVERAYVYTTYHFIAQEIYTQKTGARVDDGNRMGTAAAWLCTTAQKLAEGEMIVDLVIRESHADDPDRPYIVFSVPQPTDRAAGVQPNFRPGDAVVIYRRDSDDDRMTNKQAFKGSIDVINATTVGIRLRAAQRNTAVLPTTAHYAMEHDAMDTGGSLMFGGLSALIRTTQDRRDLLLSQRRPRTATHTSSVPTDEDDFGRIVRKAVEAEDYFLLVGPPGTGKTSMALRSMVEAFMARGEEILLLAYTNRAVDEICRMLSRLQPECDYLRLGSELACEPAYHDHLLANAISAYETRRDVRHRIATCHVFVGTVTTLSLHTELFALKTFDVAIVDEASQLLEPQLLGLLCHKQDPETCAIRKFILVGDHKQLPAVVVQTDEQSAVADARLHGIGLYNLRDSLFERLHRWLLTEERRSKDGWSAAPFVDMLCRQGRMHPAVAAFPGAAFYEGRLTAVGLAHQVEPAVEADHPWAAARLLFVAATAEPGEGLRKSNAAEARIVARLATEVYRRRKREGAFDPLTDVGIIAPYRSQIACIRAELERTGIDELSEVTVDTVERYQGSERDVVIFSFCVNDAEQLALLSNVTVADGVPVDRKLNVALTRARKQMWMTGVPELLHRNDIYARLLDHVAANGVWIADNG